MKLKPASRNGGLGPISQGKGAKPRVVGQEQSFPKTGLLWRCQHCRSRGVCLAKDGLIVSLN